jgi:hypothetical protein
LLGGDEEVALKTPIVQEPSAERVEQSAIQLIGDPGRPNPEVDHGLEVRPSIIIHCDDLRLGEEEKSSSGQPVCSHPRSNSLLTITAS